MAFLRQFNGALEEHFRGEHIRQLSARYLYFVVGGRNAWHSTWISRYSPGSMHLTFSSAAAHAERSRVQGTVFTIQQLPALEFVAEAGRVYVTQINEATPLRAYSAHAIEALSAHVSRSTDIRDNYMAVGAPVVRAVRSFSYDSRFWRNAPPSNDSVLVLGCLRSKSKSEKIKKEIIKQWSSRSIGTDRPLSWGEQKANRTASAVMYLVTNQLNQ